MEQRNQRRTFPTKQCQVDGCEEISVGSKVPLCRKHRNKTYKQNYKKKKRNAAGAHVEEKEIVIDDQYLLEQKYSNMLQDVLTQKQMELFESPAVVNLLKSYQTCIARNTPKTQVCSKPSEPRSPIEQQQQSQGAHVYTTNSAKSSDVREPNENAFAQSSLNYAHCYTGGWNSTAISVGPKTETSLLGQTTIGQKTPGSYSISLPSHPTIVFQEGNSFSPTS